ncbi:MAG: hypothetical protein REH83_05015 [Rickettsiella sp.]|nr:hypothetical protein [Rickettsiella sp.]
MPKSHMTQQTQTSTLKQNNNGSVADNTTQSFSASASVISAISSSSHTSSQTSSLLKTMPRNRLDSPSLQSIKKTNRASTDIASLHASYNSPKPIRKAVSDMLPTANYHSSSSQTLSLKKNLYTQLEENSKTASIHTTSTSMIRPRTHSFSQARANTHFTSVSRQQPPQTPPPAYQMIRFTPIEPENAKDDLEFYLQLFSEKIKEKLSIIAAPSEWQVKKREMYQSTIGEELKKKTERQKLLAKSSIREQVLNGKTTTIASLIGTSGGIGITAGFGLGIIAGGYATGITATALLGYFVYNWIKATIDKNDAKNLMVYLPEDDSHVINLIASLAALYAVNTLDSEFKIKFSLKLTVDPVRLTAIFKYLYSGKKSEAFVQDLDDQIKAVYELAKTDAEKIFKYLKRYANDPKTRLTNGELFSQILPNSHFVYSHEFRSKEVVKTCNYLTAWCYALDKLISKKDNLHAKVFYANIKPIRESVETDMQAYKKKYLETLEIENERSDQDSIISAQSSATSKSHVHRWVDEQNSQLNNYTAPIGRSKDTTSTTNLMFFTPPPTQIDKDSKTKTASEKPMSSFRIGSS